MAIEFNNAFHNEFSQQSGTNRNTAELHAGAFLAATEEAVLDERRKQKLVGSAKSDGGASFGQRPTAAR